MDSLEHLEGNCVLYLVFACASLSCSAVPLGEEPALTVLSKLLKKPLSVMSELACDTKWAVELVKVSSARTICLLLFSMHGCILVNIAALLCAPRAFATEEVSAKQISLFSRTCLGTRRSRRIRCAIRPLRLLVDNSKFGSIAKGDLFFFFVRRDVVELHRSK